MTKLFLEDQPVYVWSPTNLSVRMTGTVGSIQHSPLRGNAKIGVTVASGELFNWNESVVFHEGKGPAYEENNSAPDFGIGDDVYSYNNQTHTISILGVITGIRGRDCFEINDHRDNWPARNIFHQGQGPLPMKRTCKEDVFSDEGAGKTVVSYGGEIYNLKELIDNNKLYSSLEEKYSNLLLAIKRLA